MKKKIIIPIIIALMLLSMPIVHAANQFQDVIDLLEDVFVMVATVMTLPVLSTPAGSFGLFLFMFWLMLFSILNYGARAAFGGANQRMITIISVALSTMVIILLNFQRSLMVSVIGNWLVWIWFIFVMAAVILPPYLAHRHLASRGTAWGYFFTGLICFFSLMMALNNKNSFEGFITYLDSFVNYYSVTFALGYFLKKKVRNGK